MLKKLMFAVVPVLMLAGISVADDTDLSIDAASITDADVNIVEAGLDIDVDQLAADAGSEKKVDAIEACFRRCGYNSYGWGGRRSCYGSFYGSGYGNYGNYGNFGCYQPYYGYTNYGCAQPMYYTSYVCQPVYSYYWGCH